MAEAKTALELLSREASAQRLAEMRQEAEIERRLDRADARREGRVEGRVEGRREVLGVAVASLCAVLGIELDDARRARLAQADERELTSILASLRDRRVWPD